MLFGELIAIAAGFLVIKIPIVYQLKQLQHFNCLFLLLTQVH